MLMLPTSLPGGSPGGMTAARPTWPRAASDASTGVDAASSGVRPPSSSIGSSAHPSGTHTTYFMASSRTHSGRRVDVLLHRHQIGRQLDQALVHHEEIGETLGQQRTRAGPAP